MWRKAALTVAAVITLAACSSPATTGGGATTAPPASPAATEAMTTPPAATMADTPTAEATAQGAAVDVDPCTVLPLTEATTLVGVTVQPGQSSTLSGGGKVCSYSAGANGIVQITIAKATSAADAAAVWDQERAQANQALQQALNSQVQLNPQIQDITGVGDKASTAAFSGTVGPVTFSGSAIYVLKGATFFGLSVLRLNGTPPTADQLKAEALTILSRI